MPTTAATSISNEELARRARSGCMASFERLLRQFQTPVLHFLRRQGFRPADAEDLAQETFLRAFENLRHYDFERSFAAWLFTIARRTGLNHRRRTRPEADHAAVEAAISGGQSPIAIVAAEEERRLLWDRAAESLAEDQFTALWLHYAEDMPLADIAMVLERSPSAVKILLHRARRRLAPLLAAHESDLKAKRLSKSCVVR